MVQSQKIIIRKIFEWLNDFHSINKSVIVLGLHLTGSGVTGLAHFDGCSTSQGVTDMISRVCHFSQSAQEGRQVP